MTGAMVAREGVVGGKARGRVRDGLEDALPPPLCTGGRRGYLRVYDTEDVI